MPWAVAAAVIGGGAAIYAASEQSNAADKATKVEEKQFAQTQANEKPFLDAGTNSLAELMKGLGIGPGAGGAGYGDLTKSFSPDMYHQSPEFQFLLNQGNENILNTASARGGVNSGNTLRDLEKFGVGLANEDYQQAYQNYTGDQSRKFNMLDTITGSGQNAAANLGAIGANTATNISNNITGAANAGAAGIVGGANAATSGINNYLLYSLLQGQLGGDMTVSGSAPSPLTVGAGNF